MPATSEEQSQQQARPPIQNDWRSNRNRLTDELKSQIVKECCEDLISPAELASRHGVNVVQIRKVVKDAGQKLPTKYKITSSKSIRYVKILAREPGCIMSKIGGYVSTQ